VIIYLINLFTKANFFGPGDLFNLIFEKTFEKNLILFCLGGLIYT